ncbi:MAG: c-type cytochrome [Betaproteobacteria bacterium]|nr:c-type cytochrome [Betaproteobacteria bacterium]
MSRSASLSHAPAALLLAALLCASAGAVAQGKYPGIGRPATPAEVKAWDTDVRSDFTGLPKGSGSAKKGEEVWDAKCASCHGTFAESNEVFPPIVGGTTAEDIKNGRVAGLAKSNEGRTTLMKLSRISTLWDYIHRSMPWTAPRSLSVEETYAVTAYILALGRIVPEDFVLSDANMAEVQARLPNRNGTTTAHGLWTVKGRPDVKNTACMKDCPTEAKVMSQLPAHARDAHGNIAEQNRVVGPVRGAVTVRAAAGAAAPVATAAPAASADRIMAEKNGCLACHGVDNKIVGPGFKEIAARYKDAGGSEAKLAAKIKAGGAGTWGAIPMPPHPGMKDEDINSLVKWILGGAR